VSSFKKLLLVGRWVIVINFDSSFLSKVEEAAGTEMRTISVRSYPNPAESSFKSLSTLATFGNDKSFYFLVGAKALCQMYSG
jgi:hypothetical protein